MDQDFPIAPNLALFELPSFLAGGREGSIPIRHPLVAPKVGFRGSVGDLRGLYAVDVGVVGVHLSSALALSARHFRTQLIPR